MIPRSLFLASTATLLTFAACVDDEVDQVAADLELENGGLDTTDEAPEFGAPDELAAAQIEAGDVYADPMGDDAETVAMRAVAGALRGRIVLVWGQLPPDLTPEAYARDWSGRLAVNRGAVVVRRTIGFEEATDRVMPRTDRLAVDFASITRPFADGLILEVIDPDPANVEPFVLTYAGDDGTSHELAIEDLLAGPVVRVVDDQGDRVAATLVRDEDGCNHGFGRGRWRALRDGLGRLHGEIADADGAPIGHLRGIWGERHDGEQAFFGKYIAVDGSFRGIFAGHYRDGQMHGRWLGRDGETGRLDGGYRESLPGRAVGGHFLLRWAETSCAQDIAEDTL